MRLLPYVTLLTAFAIASVATPSDAANHTVVVTPSLTFEPAQLTIQAGDSVTWTNNGGAHNVRADDDAFRCSSGCDGDGGDGSPSSANWSFTLTFDDPADIPYYCEVHGAAGGVGMSGRLTVEDGGASPTDPDAIFADDFETGDYCRWSGDENLPPCQSAGAEPEGNFLQVSEAASRPKSGGVFGLESIYSERPDAAFLIDRTPDSVGHYQATFWLQPTRDFQMARGASHVILEARGESSPDPVLALFLEGQKKSKIFRVRVGAQTESGFEDYGSLKVRRGKWSRVTVDWQAAADGSTSGFVCLAKQAQCAKGKRDLIDNPLLAIDSIHFGQVTRPDVGTTGSVHLDDFSSRSEGGSQAQDDSEDSDESDEGPDDPY